ncbi:MAG: SLC13 family permease, partial [Pseudomonadota bacterium]|nr:SLC13 family permease [Pseudomonadota bacterium]
RYRARLADFSGGLAVFAALCLRRRRVLMSCLREISWSMLLLVAGLFVLVEALQQSGVVALLSRALHNWIVQTPDRAAWYAAGAATLAGNLANNLPVGLLTGAVVGVAQPPQPVTSALLVAVDLGPNWSVTGSLATMLWLAALRREKVSVSALDFLKVGTVVTLPTLIATLWSLLR